MDDHRDDQGAFDTESSGGLVQGGMPIESLLSLASLRQRQAHEQHQVLAGGLHRSWPVTPTALIHVMIIF
jgi:hypothetical protein